MTARDGELESVRFLVHNRPVCVWSPRLFDENLAFLRGLDPSFFLHQAQFRQADGVGERNDKAAIYEALSLRMNYELAVEGFLSILCAIVQAPDCVFGWLHSYRNHELLEMVKSINEERPVRALAPLRPATWAHLAAQIFRPLASRSPEQHARIASLFSKAWRQFATEFADPVRHLEYNCIKHGFRVAPSSFKIDIRHEGEVLLASTTNTGYRFPILKQNPGRKWDFSVSTAAVTLEPEAYRAGLFIAGLSIQNAVAFARARAGDDGESVALRIPNDEAAFQAFFSRPTPIQTLTYGVACTPDEYISESDVFAVYDIDESEREA